MKETQEARRGGRRDCEHDGTADRSSSPRAAREFCQTNGQAGRPKIKIGLTKQTGALREKGMPGQERCPIRPVEEEEEGEEAAGQGLRTKKGS